MDLQTLTEVGITGRKMINDLSPSTPLIMDGGARVEAQPARSNDERLKAMIWQLENPPITTQLREG